MWIAFLSPNYWERELAASEPTKLEPRITMFYASVALFLISSWLWLVRTGITLGASMFLIGGLNTWLPVAINNLSYFTVSPDYSTTYILAVSNVLTDLFSMKSRSADYR